MRPHSNLQYRTPVEFAAQAASFYTAGLGQEASNAGPLPSSRRGTQLLIPKSGRKLSTRCS
jgi:hypothetical protein